MTEESIFLERDLDASILEQMRIGLVGYGSQGRAQALNLRDGGFSPSIGVRKGGSFDRAVADGFSPVSVAEVSGAADVIVVLVPDEIQPGLCADEIIPRTKKGALLGFATGFNIHFGLVKPPDGLEVFLVAPKGPGEVLRERFLQGSSIPALVASLRAGGQAMAVARAYAKAIGCARAGVITTTFEEEAVADLFGEQCVLSGGMIELMKAAFRVLVDAGYSSEVAYVECISEVEYMASLISKVGIDGLADHISSTAHYGGLTRGRRIIDAETKRRLELILGEIRDGRFAEEFSRYVASGTKIRMPADESGRLKAARSNLGVGS